MAKNFLMVAVGVVLTIVVFFIAVSCAKTDEDSIPMPPAGYEYCADDGYMHFCRKGE